MNEECSFLSFIFLQNDLSDCEKMQKSNYSSALITHLIITITLSQYHKSPNRKRQPQIAPIFGHFTLLAARCRWAEHGIFFPVTFVVAHGICLCLQSCYYILPRILLLHHCVSSLWLFNIPSSFQKPSPEQYIILPWLLGGNGSCTCLERGTHSPGWESSYLSRYLTISVYVVVKCYHACSERLYPPGICQPLSTYHKE